MSPMCMAPVKVWNLGRGSSKPQCSRGGKDAQVELVAHFLSQNTSLFPGKPDDRDSEAVHRLVHGATYSTSDDLSVQRKYAISRMHN